MEEYMEQVLNGRLTGEVGDEPGAAEIQAEEAARAAMMEAVKTPLDLNDEKVAATLEDPGLLAHMARARERCKEHMESEKKISESEASQSLTMAMSELSGITRQYREIIQALEQGSVEMYAMGKQLSNAKRGKSAAPYFVDIKPPATLNDDTVAFINSLVDPAVKCINESTAKINKALEDYKKINTKLSNVHQKTATAFNQITHIIRQKSQLIASQNEVLVNSAALFDYNEVMEAKKRAEVLQFMRRSSKLAPTKSAPAPADGIPVPAESADAPVPAGGIPVPAESAGAPADGAGASAESAGASADGAGAPAESAGAPADGTGASADGAGASTHSA